MKLKLSPEKTKIIHARKKGVEFLGFHFNGRWRRPKHKAKKKFKEEVKRLTRRQQPISLETVIRFLNPLIRGWGNYYKGGTVKKLYGDLDSYIRARLRSFKAKKRNLKTILFTLPQTELKKMGLISLSSLLNESVSCKGIRQTKAVYGKTVRTV
ncbi:Group II intron, maturase-specific domain [uncultured archaeon]|nr:Group II intron, maturase-specific domain [uncultured archaeon]